MPSNCTLGAAVPYRGCIHVSRFLVRALNERHVEGVACTRPFFTNKLVTKATWIVFIVFSRVMCLRLYAPHPPVARPPTRWKVDFEKNVVVSNFEVGGRGVTVYRITI